MEQFFSCTKCGACCDSPVNFNLNEVFNFSQSFLFALKANFFIVKDLSFLDKNKQEHLSKMGYVWQLPEKRYYFFLYLTLQGIKVTPKCPMLVDNLCSIYATRPNHCQLIPLNVLEPEVNFLQEFSKKWIPLIEKKEYHCSVSNNDPLIYKDKNFSNPQTEDMFYDELFALKKLNTDFYDLFLAEEADLKRYIGKWSEMAEKSFEKKSFEYLPLIDLLIKYYERDILSTEHLQFFIENQLSLAKKLNLQNFDKNLYYYENKYIEHTIDYLKNLDIFDKNNIVKSI